jgi:hypothetical protein
VAHDKSVATEGSAEHNRDVKEEGDMSGRILATMVVLAASAGCIIQNDDPCNPNPCGAGQLCVAGFCQDNPCDPNPCPVGQYCSGGLCYDSDPCTPNPCSAGQYCSGGLCYSSDPCVPNPCDVGETCVAGVCYPPADPCNPNPCGAGQWCMGGLCYGEGVGCGFVNDQDCANVSQAWWCAPDGTVRLNDCLTQCAGLAPYACCGYDPSRGDDACLCCMTADCSGLTCEGGPPADPCNPNPCGFGEWCVDGSCYTTGATCGFVNDQECVNRTEAWWCSPDGNVYVNDCLTQCAGLAPYACCGFDPSRGDDACLCCATADCSGLTCEP